MIGGEQYEPDEENPMIGFRGCGRYTDPFFEECFAMELEAQSLNHGSLRWNERMLQQNLEWCFDVCWVTIIILIDDLCVCFSFFLCLLRLFVASTCLYTFMIDLNPEIFPDWKVTPSRNRNHFVRRP